MSTIALGLVHGRFQPPHNGHIRYILAALDKCDRLLIGICTPTLCTTEEADRTGYPCTPEQNPFSYEDRVEMIRRALDELHIDQNRYSFLPFPSDYTDIADLVPSETVFCMSVSGPADHEKIAHLSSQGWKSEIVFEAGEARERSGAIREDAKKGGTAWKESLPHAVAQYIQEKNGGMLQ